MGNTDKRMDQAESLIRMQGLEMESMEKEFESIKMNHKDIYSKLEKYETASVSAVSIAAAEKYVEQLPKNLSKMYDNLQRIMKVR